MRIVAGNRGGSIGLEASGSKLKILRSLGKVPTCLTLGECLPNVQAGPGRLKRAMPYTTRARTRYSSDFPIRLLDSNSGDDKALFRFYYWRYIFLHHIARAAQAGTQV